MSITNIRLEVMHFLEKNVENFITQFLVPVEKIIFLTQRKKLSLKM